MTDLSEAKRVRAIAASMTNKEWKKTLIEVAETYERLQRFQASGSDAPAPVPMYERGD